MEIQPQREMKKELEVRRSAVEDVVFVGGRPQIERADMPLSLSFDSIEDLERFCGTMKNRD